MPRPKSELTGVGTNIAVRLIPAHYEEWKRLGGPKWLRQQLSQSIKNKNEETKPVKQSLSYRTIV
jgi:hypothetical protein